MQAPLLYGVLSQVTEIPSTAFSYEGSSGYSSLSASVSFDIKSSGNQRLVLFSTGIEGTTVPTAVTCDGKSMTNVLNSINTSSGNNASSLWAIGEDDLGSSSGTVTINYTGAISTMGGYAYVFYGIPSATEQGTAFNNTFANESGYINVTASPSANDLIFYHACHGSSGTYTVSTSPLSIIISDVQPNSAIAGTGYGRETTDQTDKEYGYGTPYVNRASSILAYWTANE